MQTEHNVFSEVIAHDLCIGCGICASVCPSSAIAMQWAENGDLVATRIGACHVQCGSCLMVCPFSDLGVDEGILAKQRFDSIEGIRYGGLVGYYLSAYVGFSKVDDQRSMGASGGMCTWMLESLLEAHLVDAVIGVGRGWDSNCLFRYVIADTPEEVRAMAGSRYYPVHVADVVAQVMSAEAERKYAIVGLPCVLKAVRSAMDVYPKLKRQIQYLIGLVCNHMPNRYYTEYLTCLSGVSPSNTDTVDYRLKRGRTASNFHFSAHCRRLGWGSAVPYRGCVDHAWSWSYFQLNACNYCEDVFAEVADAVFMDAWLPEYAQDPNGHSIMLVRSPSVEELASEGLSRGSCKLDRIAMQEVISSQPGAIKAKRDMLAGRLYGASINDVKVPRKRTSPSRDAWDTHRRRIVSLAACQMESKRLWSKDGANSRFLHLRLFRSNYQLVVSLWWSRLHRLIRELLVHVC